MNSVRQANSGDALSVLRKQFDETFNEVQTGLAKLKQDQDAARDAMDAVAAATQALAFHATVSAGIFALREQFLRVRASIASITRSLKADGTKLREMVSTIVADAEKQAAESQRASASAIDTSRIWLLLITLSTLVIAGLIVWLFVHRYVVSQTRRARRQHARHRPRQPRNAYSRGRPGRAWRNEPGARRLPRQRARDPDREGSGHRGARPRPRRRPAPSRASSPT